MKNFLLSILFCSSNIILIAQAGLIRHYPLDGNADDIVSGQNGTIVGGVTITSDETLVFGTAMSFNGTDGFIELPPAGMNLDSLTYSICLKPKFIPASGQAYACVSVGTSAADQYIYLVKDLLSLQGWGTSSYYTPYVYPPFQMSVGSLPNAGQWYNVIFTTGRYYEKLYVDGILIDSISKAGKLLDYGSVSSIQARIGSRAGAPLGNQHFNGVIKDVKIFNRPLRIDEIQTICDNTNGIVNSSNECIPYLINENNSLHLSNKSECNIQHFNCKVFNILGQPIYNATDIDFQWSNINLPSGRYIYQLTGTIDGQKFQKNNSFFVD